MLSDISFPPLNEGSTSLLSQQSDPHRSSPTSRVIPTQIAVVPRTSNSVTTKGPPISNPPGRSQDPPTPFNPKPALPSICITHARPFRGVRNRRCHQTSTILGLHEQRHQRRQRIHLLTQPAVAVKHAALPAHAAETFRWPARACADRSLCRGSDCGHDAVLGPRAEPSCVCHPAKGEPFVEAHVCRARVRGNGRVGGKRLAHGLERDAVAEEDGEEVIEEPVDVVCPTLLPCLKKKKKEYQLVCTFPQILF